jgi:ParB-like chromosome segregation protein Spo0J
MADPKTLRENPANWRLHPSIQAEGLAAVLDEVGWVQDVIVNKRTGNLVDGHLRVQLSATRGEKKVPVTYVDLSREEEALVLTTLDPIAALAATDRDKIGALLDQLAPESQGLKVLLDDLRKTSGVDTYVPKPLDELEAEVGAVPEDAFWPLWEVRLDPHNLARWQVQLDRRKGKNNREQLLAIIAELERAATK